MSKQTAVEWLVEQVESISNSKGVSKTETIKLYNDAIQKAKAMEKEQIIEANADGQYLNSVSLTKRMCLDNAESYYNETYGGDQ